MKSLNIPGSLCHCKVDVMLSITNSIV